MDAWVARRVVGAHVLVSLLLLWTGLAGAPTPLQLAVTVGAAALLTLATVHQRSPLVRLAVTATVRPPGEAVPAVVTPYWREVDLPHRPACPRAPGLR